MLILYSFLTLIILFIFVLYTNDKLFFFFFFFNDTATTEIYTLSLHDALPIFLVRYQYQFPMTVVVTDETSHKFFGNPYLDGDRKSTRLNSSHQIISYAVFCLKKKK